MDNRCVFTLDMGGTFIKFALVRPDGTFAAEPQTVPANSGGSLEDIQSAWRQAIALLTAEAAALRLRPEGVGISIPGPFDFAKGKSRMRHKYQAIYGMSIAEELYNLGLNKKLEIRFIQDANAFLEGERFCGAAKDFDFCSGVTLGTGLGFSTVVDGKLMTNGCGSPYIALYRQPFWDGVLEDVVSAGGICAEYLRLAGLPGGMPVTAKEVGRLARENNPAAVAAMYRLGQVLGSQIAYLLIHTRCRCLVLGGQISKDFKLFEQPLLGSLAHAELEQVVPATHPQDAALYGAAALYYHDKCEGVNHHV